jgi:hypothetical protein
VGGLRDARRIAPLRLDGSPLNRTADRAPPVPPSDDELMDDPGPTKAGLRDAHRRMLDLDFDRLLLAHGDPIVHGGKDELFAFVERA